MKMWIKKPQNAPVLGFPGEETRTSIPAPLPRFTGGGIIPLPNTTQEIS